MKKLAVLLVLMVMALVGCTKGTSESGGDTAPQGESKDKVIIGFEADAGTLMANTDVNYATDAQIRNIYDPLIGRDADTGEYIPVLAESWASVDEHTWRIKLKDNVKFHNDKMFNAEAVKFSIDYMLDEKNNSFYRSRWENIKEVKVLSDTEVEITTKEPFPGLIERITVDLLIMEPSYVKEVGNEEAGKKPIGTGAYKFEEWSRDNYLKLVAFDDYWQGAPKIKAIEFRYIPEFSSRLSTFLSGEIDLFKNVPVDSVEKVKAGDNAKIEEVASSRINYLALNTFYDGPLQDVKVRQAINYAVNVDELLESVLNGHGTKMTGPLSQLNMNYTETKDYGYNEEKAVALLKEAGYKPEDIILTLDTPSGRYPMDVQIAQGIAAQLQRVGIKVDVKVNEWGTHLEKIRNREMGDMYILGWGPAFEPQSTVVDLFTKEAPYSGFYDEAVQAKIFKTVETFDDDERREGYNELQHTLVEQASWVPLWQQADLYAVKKDLNFKPRVDEEISAFYMSWK
ncbi:ABC transporter substrate-binding protein [Lysinibacillus alkalisoli]|uniref:ABC transporter substrate-binding protein n=1 Tax=Lysinibacillus alkalisoli TaxID=1911548 RepID=A0A917G603_9BACI|nr:ABC transporter substrate-binding protein [Lysinibacillus alkalisoli]GGG24389.1 ABC transporter substrate-binding protein [Lysinibacillus alkalisoli]